MREFKFRAWDKLTEKMVSHLPEGYGLTLSYGICAFPRDQEQCVAQGHQFELMQFTGMKDKNGVEIYEGDILDGKYKAFVYFKDGRFKVKKVEEGFCSRSVARWLHLREKALCPSEIIGNIYENPELLTNKHNKE